jgi:hypothetical protein
VELLTLPVRQLSSFGSSGAELLRAALVQEAQDGFAVDVVRAARGGASAVPVRCPRRSRDRAREVTHGCSTSGHGADERQRGGPVTTLTLHATGPVGPGEVWERYAVPARWPEWAPQITGVEVPVARLAAGVRGRVRAPLGVVLPFVVETVDEAARRWSWTVSVGPVRMHLLHWVTEGPDGGSTTGLRISGPAPLVVGYAPPARLAIGRLVRPLR